MNHDNINYPIWDRNLYLRIVKLMNRKHRKMQFFENSNPYYRSSVGSSERGDLKINIPDIERPDRLLIVSGFGRWSLRSNFFR